MPDFARASRRFHGTRKGRPRTDTWRRRASEVDRVQFEAEKLKKKYKVEDWG